MLRTSRTQWARGLVGTRLVSCGSRLQSTSNGPIRSQEFSWTEYFALKKRQRRFNVASSALTAFLGANASWAYLSTMEIDPTQMILGFDPLVVVSAALLASGALGYLLGPLLGSQIFKAAAGRSKMVSFNDKNREFLQRIIKNRVDASSQSFSNPVPDYYGEKIGSIGEYRQWLRDCHAYARKAKEFL